MMREQLPWPLPIRDSRSGKVTYKPNVGNTAKEFAKMIDACEYESGARYRLRDMGLHDEASQLTRAGWCDMDKIIREQYVKHPHRKTFDQMLEEVMR